jgi:hypothetical protein
MLQYIPFSCLFYCPFKEKDIIFFIRYILVYIQYLNSVPNSIQDIELVPIEGKLGPHVFEYKKEHYIFVELPEGWDIRFHRMIQKDEHRKKHFLLDFIEYISKNVKEKTLLRKIMEEFNREFFVIEWKNKTCEQCMIETYNRKRYDQEEMSELITEFGKIEVNDKQAFENVKKYWKEWNPILRQTNKNKSMILNLFHKIIRKHIKSIGVIILTGDKQLYQEKTREIRKYFENELSTKIKFLSMKGMVWESLIYTYMQCYTRQKEWNTKGQEEEVVIYYLLQILYICYESSLTKEEDYILYVYTKNREMREIEIDKSYHETHPLLRGIWTKERLTR